MENKSVFSNRLKELRKSLKLTQSDLADKLGIVRTAVTNYETGRALPDPNTLNTLAEIFNVTTDYLLGRDSLQIKDNHTELNKRDEKDIAKDVASIMSKIKAGEDGPTYYNGVPMDEDDAELFEQALEFALRSIKIENKQKYTPKKYRK